MSTVTKPGQIPSALKVKTSHYIIGGLSLVAALTWNDAIKAGVQRVYPMEGDQVGSLILAAAMITFVVILAVYMLPDTKSELPAETKQKIAEDTIIEANEKIDQLSEKVDQLQQERLQTYNMERMRSNLIR